jgi:hypothetical protein
MARRLQIGVIGSGAYLGYSEDAGRAAERIGSLIAEKGGVLVFGAERDVDSLSTAACRGARGKGGMTVGITYGKRKDIWQRDVDVIIPCVMERGGGREFVLVLSCDAVIAIGGGSGTANEIFMAYQADIPVIALTGFGGWAAELAGKYVDERKRRRVLAAKTPEEAVRLALEEGKAYAKKYENANGKSVGE